MGRSVVCGVHGPADVRVVRYAAQLARRLAARLQLLHVPRADETPGDRLLAAVHELAHLRLEADDVDVVMATGNPEDQLALASEDAELLVIGGSGSNAIAEALGGSVSESVTREPSAPVVVVPRDDVPERIAGGVMCGVRDQRDTATAFAAARVAGGLGSPLTLVHVVMPTVVGPVGPAVMPPVEREAVKTAGVLLDELAAGLADELVETPSTVVLTGPPGPELVRAAQESGAAMVAVGASGRGPLAGAVAGTVSRYATHQARRPALVCPRGELL